LKLAWLVDHGNARQVREAIHLSSSLWGGAHFPIIPLYKKMPANWREKYQKTPRAKTVVLGLIDAFDPDVLVQLSKEVPQFVKDTRLRLVHSDEIWSVLDKQQGTSPEFGLGIFELLNEIFDQHFKYKQKYPLKVVIPTPPQALSLFWTAMFGVLPEKILAIVREHYTEPLDITFGTFQPAKMKALFAGDVMSLRRITQYGLKHFPRSSFHRDSRIFFLDATKVEDIVDYWNLRALGREVLPVPKQLQNHEQLKAIATEFLKAHRLPWRHNPQVCDFATFIRSRNSTMEEMTGFSRTLKIQQNPNDLSDSPYFSLQHWYPRIWDAWGRDKDGAEPDDFYTKEEESSEISDPQGLRIQFKPVLPNFAQEYAGHDAPRCANDVELRLYGPDEYLAEVLPRTGGDAVSSVISSVTSFPGEWRIGRDGLVRLVRHNWSESRTIPTAESVLFAWFKDRGWQAELSPPGILAKQIYRSLDGSPLFLKNDELLPLFERMSGGIVKRDGAGTDEQRIGQERDLPVGEVKNRLDGRQKRGNLYEFLVSKGIFKIGLRIQCPSCQRNSWYPLDTMRDTLTCPKCLNALSAIGYADRGTWTLKTTGPFSVPNYADGAYAVILALEFFKEQHLGAMQSTPIFSFIAKGPDHAKIEADFAMLWQDSTFGERMNGVLFGECKTYGQFKKKDIDRMKYLAKQFPGAVLVFATLRKEMKPEEIAAITRLAKFGRRYWKSDRPLNPVLILTGTELLNWLRPPGCWTEEIQKRFRHLPGLLGLCDATQQLYLGLPSWQQEWHDNWQKKARLAKPAPTTGN